MKNITKIKWAFSIILTVGVISYLYLFAFSHKKGLRANIDLLDFEATYETAEDFGFYRAHKDLEQNKLIASNNNLNLYLDQTTSHFVIEDKKSGETIRSNPDIDDPSGAKGDLLNRQKSSIIYRYFNHDGRSSSEYNNYNRSINHPSESRMPDNNYSTFKLKEIENGFQVYYEIRDYRIDYLDFPKYLEPELFEPILENKDGKYDVERRHLTGVYRDTIDDDTGKYEARDYERISNIYLNRLYKIFYEDELFGEYSRERVREENQLNGYFEDPDKARFAFEIALQIILENDGVEIKVINNSITEYSRQKLASITLYPYLGTGVSIDPITGQDTEGYMVVPDGSGAAIEFNNGKTNYQSYRRRLYGHDYANLPYEMPEDREKILLPLYGMIKENIGYSAIITKGDAMTTINAEISGRANDSYNRIYPTFHVRDNETVVLGPPWESKNVTVWSRKIAPIDFTYKIKVLTDENNNYFGVANSYKEYLINEKGLQTNDNKESKVLIELLGTFDSEEHFVGIPYKSMGTLTNYNQAKIIVNELKELGINDLDIIYNGITNGGLANKIESKVKFEKAVGNKKAFKKFEKEMNNIGIEVYPSANFFSTFKYNRAFDDFKYSSRRIAGETSKWFEYHEPTRLPYEQSPYEYRSPAKIISPLYYETIYKKYNKSFEFKNLNIENIGSNLASNFDKKGEIYKEESKLIQERFLKNTIQENIIVSEPLGFALPYISKATDLPFESTIYGLFDYQIPIVQLVLNDIMPYTISSINLPNDRDIDYMFMKVLETGSNLKYTLSYNSSIVLLNTYHNHYMSTHYKNWINLIDSQTKILKQHGLDKTHLINHERLENNLYKVRYKNNVEIILNYSLSSKEYDGINIDGMNYYIREGN